MQKRRLLRTIASFPPRKLRRLTNLVLLSGVGLAGLVSCAKPEDELMAPSSVRTAEAKSSETTEPSFSPSWRNRPVLPASAPASVATFIDPTAIITGAENVQLGQQIYIGPFARLLAARNSDKDDAQQSGTPVSLTSLGGGGNAANSSSKDKKTRISIGAETNLQDNVTVIAEAERNGRDRQLVRALDIEGVEIGERVILAHGATVKGPARIGVEGSGIEVDPDEDQEVFLSFGCEVDGAILEKNTGVSALGRVGPGVRLRSGFIVLPGKNVTSQAEADDVSLGKVRRLVEADILFNEGVLEVNIAFAREYTNLFRDKPFAVFGINVDPGHTEFNEERNLPTFAGRAVRLPVFPNRIIGDVKIENSLPSFLKVMGFRISLRADEGEPFTIGRVARMSDNVIFHALEGTLIRTGDNIRYGERAIVHGGGRRPLAGGGDDADTILEDDVQLKSQAVVFRALIGRGAVVGEKSLVVNCDIAPGTVIQPRQVFINNAFFGTVEW